LFATILRSGISFGTTLIVARLLGPPDFGRMVFLLASFSAFKALLDMASSSAFFTFLSQRQRSKKFVKYYFIWVLFQFFVSLVIVGLIIPSQTLLDLFKEESKTLVLLALVASFMQHHLWTISSQYAEAFRQTIQIQSISLILTLLHFVLVISLWHFGILILPVLFTFLILEWSGASILAIRSCKFKNDYQEIIQEDENPKTVFLEFWNYCLPFLPFAFMSFFYEFVDRWMLQHWGGATEQAYYGVASRVSTIALLATTSILKIFWKEIAEANYLNNKVLVKNLYLKVSRLLFCAGALFVGALLPWTEEIILITLGVEYIGGVLTLGIMFIYPIHQSMGQIGGTMLLATEKASLHIKIVLFFMVLSLAVSYFLQAPLSAPLPGLGLGSTGLAFKMVCIQILQVNVIAFYIAKIYGIKFKFFYQFVCVLYTISAGLISKYSFYDYFDSNILLKFSFSMMIYSIIILLTLFYFRVVLGVEKINFRKLLSFSPNIN
jgi:O-antigen/teichoic acid export membrane protein